MHESQAFSFEQCKPAQSFGHPFELEPCLAIVWPSLLRGRAALLSLHPRIGHLAELAAEACLFGSADALCSLSLLNAFALLHAHRLAAMFALRAHSAAATKLSTRVRLPVNLFRALDKSRAENSKHRKPASASIKS